MPERRVAARRAKDGRGGGIRTHDFYVPNVARYQAALHPADFRMRERPYFTGSTGRDKPICCQTRAATWSFLLACGRHGLSSIAPEERRRKVVPPAWNRQEMAAIWRWRAQLCLGRVEMMSKGKTMYRHSSCGTSVNALSLRAAQRNRAGGSRCRRRGRPRQTCANLSWV